MILLTLSRGKGEETVRLQLPASPVLRLPKPT